MKNWFIMLYLKAKKYSQNVSVTKEFSKLQLEDKKGIILDQLTFGITTVESLELLDLVNKEFKNRMEIRKQESSEIVQAIAQYYE